jgi:Na+-driven multidrug efflux pump
MALPSVLVPISLNTSQLVVASYYAAVGTAAIAALTYSRNTLLLVTVAGSSAMAMTIQIYVAHYQGQGNWKGADRCMKLGLAGFIPVVFGFIGLVAISSSTVLGFYTGDQEVVAYGGQILAAMCLSETFRAVNAVVYPALRGSNDVKLPMAAAIVSHWALAVGCGWLFLHLFGWQLWGVLLAVILADGFVAVVNLNRWFGLHWQKLSALQIRKMTGERDE